MTFQLERLKLDLTCYRLSLALPGSSLPWLRETCLLLLFIPCVSEMTPTLSSAALYCMTLSFYLSDLAPEIQIQTTPYTYLTGLSN